MGPRHRKRGMGKETRQPAANQSNNPAILPKASIDKLVTLSRATLSFEHIIEFQSELNSENNHRGSAILIASTVENVLETAILRILTKGRTKRIFGHREPLGGFSNKILMGYALNIYGDEMFGNLEIIRNIRNAFAHSKVPISFETPEVANVCAALQSPVVIPPYAVGSNEKNAEGLIGLARYRFVADRISHNLLWVNMHGIKKLQVQAYPIWVQPETHEIVVRARPLP